MRCWKRVFNSVLVGGAIFMFCGQAYAETQQQYPCPVEQTATRSGDSDGGGGAVPEYPCGGGPTCSISNDCNNNNIDDRCDASCLNSGQFCVGGRSIFDNCTRTSACGNDPDCNNNDRPDSCDLSGNDCNGNGVPDECDADCNANGVPDDCDIAGGTSTDFNGNGIPDDCEDCDGDGIPDDLENNPGDQDCDGDGLCNSLETPDCNGNSVPDVCETDPSTADFVFDSGVLAPLDGNNDQTAVFFTAPAAFGDVTLSFEAIGDLDSLDGPESVRVHMYPAVAGCGDTYLGWCTIGNVFSGAGEGSDCATTPDFDTLPVSAALYNAIVAANGGNVDIWMDPGFNVGSCVDSYIEVTASYTTTEDCDGNSVPDECDPDCNVNGVPDACDITNGTSLDCNGNGVPDECDIASGTSPDCNNNAIPDECEDDCNGNGVPDDCDIDPTDPDGDTFVSQDCDLSDLPDECEASADPAGSRYVEVTMGGFDYLDDLLDPAIGYRILIEPYPDGMNACNTVWVQDGGHLTDDPLLADIMTPDDWCTQYVHDAFVIPSGVYVVVAEDPNGPDFLQWNIETFPYGDANRNGYGYFDIWDIICVLNCFQGDFTEECTLLGCDQAPARVYGGDCLPPDGYINLDDLLAVIDAFNGYPYPCPDPCFTGPPMAPPSPPSATAGLQAVETPHEIEPGDYVNVDVFVSGAADLRAYQLAVTIAGGSSGTLTLVDAFVDEARTDYAFYGVAVETYAGADLAGGRVANVLEDGGVDATASVYAATLRFQASGGADGTFTATAQIGDAALRDSSGEIVGIATTLSTTISVTGGEIPVRK